MEYKRLKIILILLQFIGTILTAILWGIVHYSLSHWPPSSEGRFGFLGYTAIVETIILFILIPALYLGIKNKTQKV
jgi:hypothetical protein